MKKNELPTLRRAALALLALSLAACSSSGKRERVWPFPDEPYVDKPLPGVPPPGQQPPQEPQIYETPEPQPLPPGTPRQPLPDYPKTADQVSGAAVTSLIRQAQQHRAAGQPAQAAASLERALRIEPRNYFVWSALAQAYLDQKNFDQAESVAQKSNSLARGNLYVELQNWKTIRAARSGQRNTAGAVQAQSRIDEIQRVLGGG